MKLPLEVALRKASYSRRRSRHGVVPLRDWSAAPTDQCGAAARDRRRRRRQRTPPPPPILRANNMSLSVGTRVGPYEILGLIGAGGMGEVYRARDGRLRRDVAIKILPPALPPIAERLARFKREAQVLASLNHPHIAAIYGIEERPPKPGGATCSRWCSSSSTGPRWPTVSPRARFQSTRRCHRAADRRGARSGARARDRPSRPQARKHQAAARRDREGARLRAGEGGRGKRASARVRICRRNRPTATSTARRATE